MLSSTPYPLPLIKTLTRSPHGLGWLNVALVSGQDVRNHIEIVRQ